ncbi:response regulator [Paradesertivirga mongoliensis]|uniref:histidine kinase n=1 Tax=Paradesertivirga mongoliensis TaxID=2100740 RepID=A0ABW4ZN14_9SPHI|nr:response regulator [Pedobacter mongoliensis]
MSTGQILFIIVDSFPTPFWLTWWFQLIVLLAIAIALYFFHRSKVKAVEHRAGDLERQLLETRELLSYAKQNEQSSRDLAALESRNKSQLLSKISHDIRTPMTTMMGMAALLNETQLNNEQREYTNTILDSGENLLKLINDILINDILEYSRFESGKELEQKDFDLRNTIEEVLDVFASKSAKQNIDLVYDIPANVPTQVVGDAMRLHQIFTNLVKNSIRFTLNGEIFIGARFIESGDDNRVKLEFEIRDTGMGMTREKVAQLSKGFAEPVSALNTNGISSGVGLIICKNLVSLMGGSIQVSSKEHEGSTFTFTIWLRTSLQQVRSKSIGMTGMESKKILIVDDNETVCNLLTKQLQQWKLSATGVGSGKEALALLSRDSDYDLVITDMQMPAMTGVELTKAIKSLHSDMPVILLNKFDDESYKKHLGLFSSVIKKPIRQHILNEQILVALRNKNKASEQNSKQKLSVDFAKENPLKILIAEDDAMNQKMVIKVLNKLGYEPKMTSNGNEVLEEVSFNDYDIILMDVQMPEMDGLEATKMIRLCLSVQPTIIAMTANTLQGDRDACIRAGMDDYISKPVKLEDLVNVLEKWSLHAQQKNG